MEGMKEAEEIAAAVYAAVSTPERAQALREILEGTEVTPEVTDRIARMVLSTLSLRLLSSAQSSTLVHLCGINLNAGYKADAAALNLERGPMAYSTLNMSITRWVIEICHEFPSLHYAVL